MARFVEHCDVMQRHVAHLGVAGAMWARQADRMIAQAKAHRSDGFFSDHSFLLDSFGGGPLRPPPGSVRGGPLDRALRRYVGSVRARFGYGRVGDALIGPASRAERVDHALRTADAMYANAVTAGHQVLREPIERWNVRSGAIFGHQRAAVGDRELAWHTLVALKRVVVVREQLGTFGTVLEIGPGTGEFARLLLATGTAERCVLVDIPPALAFAQELIGEELGWDAIDPFAPDRGGIDAPDRRCVFLTPDQLPLVQRADAVINVASFGEMSAAAVRGYADHIKRLRPSSILSINAAQPHPLNRSEGIGSAFYEAVFAPEYAVHTRRAWTRSLETDLDEMGAERSGYEWMAFRPT